MPAASLNSGRLRAGRRAQARDLNGDRAPDTGQGRKSSWFGNEKHVLAFEHEPVPNFKHTLKRYAELKLKSHPENSQARYIKAASLTLRGFL